MTTEKLKLLLKKEIEKTEDPETLALLQIVLETRSNPTAELTQWQLSRIEESEKQYLEGKIISRIEADKKVEEWLKK